MAAGCFGWWAVQLTLKWPIVCSSPQGRKQERKKGASTVFISCAPACLYGVRLILTPLPLSSAPSLPTSCASLKAQPGSLLHEVTLRTPMPPNALHLLFKTMGTCTVYVVFFGHSASSLTVLWVRRGQGWASIRKPST